MLKIPKDAKDDVRIVVTICGGIGNQLFAYAAARRLADSSRADLIIDDVSGFARDYAFQRRYQLDHFCIRCRKATSAERLEPCSRLRRYVRRYLSRQLPFERRSYIKQEGDNFDPRLLQIKPSGTLYLEGYWQSEEYFKDIEQTIRDDLQIRPPLDGPNQAVARKISGVTAVGVHVRFFDQPQVASANNTPTDYYARAIAQLERITTNAHYFVFSDRPEAARPLIPLPDDRITLVTHNHGDDSAYADLWLMTHCQHFVIANSTFGWWGAWLARSPQKVVIAPLYSQRDGKVSWGFEGQLPESWVKI